MSSQVEEIAGELRSFTKGHSQPWTIAEGRPSRAVAGAVIGRPSIYTPELAAEICEEVSRGGALHRICKERSHWPDRWTIYRWADEKPEFNDRFTRARELKAHLYVEEMVEEAETATPLGVRVSELVIKTKQWVASRLVRKDYGDQAQVTAAVQINLTGVASALESKVDELNERVIEGST